MPKRMTFCREAVYTEEYEVEIPDDISEDEWKKYLTEVVDIYDSGTYKSFFKEYLDTTYFKDFIS